MSFVINKPIQLLGSVESWPAFTLDLSSFDAGTNYIKAVLYVNLPDWKHTYFNLYSGWNLEVTRPVTTITIDLSQDSVITKWPDPIEQTLLWDCLEDGSVCSMVLRLSGSADAVTEGGSEPQNRLYSGHIAAAENDVFLQFTKGVSHLVVASPGRNLGILEGFAPLDFDLAVAGGSDTFVLADTYINLPQNRYIHFPQEAFSVDRQNPSTTVTVNLPALNVYGDDGSNAGTLWENLEPGTIYSLVVKFNPSRLGTVTTNPMDGRIQTGQIRAGERSAVCVFVKAPQTAAASYGLIVTDIGEQKIAQRIANGQKLVITQAGIDDGNGHEYTPQKNQTSLFNEVWRGDIAAAEADGNTIRVLTVLGASVGNFWGRAVCLYDEDGDMVAISKLAPFQKVSSASGIDFKLKILLNLIVTDASAIEIIVNPILNTVDYEQLQEALAELTAVFEGDLTGHNNDPLAHPAVRSAINTAIADAKTQLTDALMPKQYGSVARAPTKHIFYELSAKGGVIGGGFTPDMNYNGDNFTLPDCGKNFVALDVTATYSEHYRNSVLSNEGQLSVTAAVDWGNPRQPIIHVNDDEPQLGNGNRGVYVTFVGRVAM